MLWMRFRPLKKLGSVSETSGLRGGAVRGHGLPVSGELEGVILFPLALKVLPDTLGGLQAASGLGNRVGIDLLSKSDEGSLGGLSDLLENSLEIVEVEGRVVAHDGDGGHFLNV